MDDRPLQELMILEENRKTAEANYSKNPFDADNLTKWGVTLIELSHFGADNQESKKMIKGAISKLQEALAMDPKKHEALWHLGNAYTTEAFLTLDHTVALACLAKASQSYKKAVEEDPENHLYLKSLAASAKAPILYMELQPAIVQQAQTLTQTRTRTETQSSTSLDGFQKKKSNDLTYDICGWIILGIGIMAWIGMPPMRTHVPPRY